MILEPKKIKSATVCIASPSICHEVMGSGGGLVAKSCPTLVTPWTVQPARLFCPLDSPGDQPDANYN